MRRLPEYDYSPARKERPAIATATRLTDRELRLYGGTDPREHPRYSFPEAARALDLPASTLRSWVAGQSYARKHDRGYFEPVIRRPLDDDPRLSFTNLIEAHVLRALRRVHEVKLSCIREAIDVAEREFGIERLLISPELRASAGQLFLERYGDLLELNGGQQLAMAQILRDYMERVEFDESRMAAEFFPFERSPRNFGRRLIALSPFVSFGRLRLQRTGVSTRAVVGRIEAGEDPRVVMEDYGLDQGEFEEAVLYEAAA